VATDSRRELALALADLGRDAGPPVDALRDDLERELAAPDALDADV
jgi:hypothetical protein